jgi:hypothetical protein
LNPPGPGVVSHTYQVRDFAPKLAASLGKGMIGDCIGYRNESGKRKFCTANVSGKTATDVSFWEMVHGLHHFNPAHFAQTK